MLGSKHAPRQPTHAPPRGVNNPIPTTTTGATVGQLPCIPIASSVTSYGRELLFQTKAFVEKHYTIDNGFPANAEVCVCVCRLFGGGDWRGLQTTDHKREAGRFLFPSPGHDLLANPPPVPLVVGGVRRHGLGHGQVRRARGGGGHAPGRTRRRRGASCVGSSRQNIAKHPSTHGWMGTRAHAALPCPCLLSGLGPSPLSLSFGLISRSPHSFIHTPRAHTPPHDR